MRSILTSQVCGLAGVLAGALLVAPVLFPVSPNAMRLVLFNVGAVACAVGMARWLQPMDPSRYIGLMPVIVGNAIYGFMVLVALGVDSPFSGSFGLWFFFAGIALWLGDASFGGWLLAQFHKHPLVQLAGALLLFGSLMAFAGLDRLGLATRNGADTFWVQVALAGIVLNGSAWCLLGVLLVSGGLHSVTKQRA